MNGINYILTGPPRSGTTLTCFLLNKLPDTIALHEPMRLSMFPNPQEGLEAVYDFFKSSRESLLTSGKALSRVSGDQIPDNPFPQNATEQRKSVVRKDWVQFDKPLSPQFNLLIKHNAHFTFLLPELIKHYPCAVIIRNPVSVLASWNTIDAPVAKGLLNILPYLRPDLHQKLEAEKDVLDRQVLLLHFFFEQYRQLPDLKIIRYEDIIATSGKALSDIIPAASQLNEPLTSKNKSIVYDRVNPQLIKERLEQFEGDYLHYYDLKTHE